MRRGYTDGKATLPRHCRRYAAGALALVLLAGCTPSGTLGTRQVYEGPSRPRDQVAALAAGAYEEYYVVYATYVDVLAIDGRPVDMLGRASYEILPGPHSVTIRYGAVPSLGASYAPQTLTFEAEAGRLYHIEARMRDGRLWSWIVDATTNDVVGGMSAPGPS